MLVTNTQFADACRLTLAEATVREKRRVKQEHSTGGKLAVMIIKWANTYDSDKPARKLNKTNHPGKFKSRGGRDKSVSL